MIERRHFLVLAAALAFGPAAAQQIDEVHFLIGSSPGSGWDQTARAVGQALQDSGIAGTTSFENIPGGAGAKAVARLTETADRQQNTLLVASTPVLIYGLQGAIGYSWNDLTPVAAVIGDYEALAVRADSELADFSAVVEKLQGDVRSVKIGGGSVVGSMDHLVAALAFKEAGLDALQMNYIPYAGGGAAMAALLSGEIDLLSTGLGEALEQQRQGQIRIIGSTATTSVGGVPTLTEQGYPVEFVNWRGFFAAPGVDAEIVNAQAAAIDAMNDTGIWAEIRYRNGWVDIYYPGADFTAFLEDQENQVRTLMNELGIETKN
ncbi:tripartite tricarboxylate transporter substrate binding protein [Mameliella alba]|uniref:tripartite tricarboxylate transporter substrate binding protein n=1 Tax=Mameliella alba TaxID=561184 RepID=UPI001C943CFD|nr:tripartite tricarboxylate transporter substrate-binding protein [Mameliella alba]MBY6120405.1 tripartite tricarboxylate transporter substrate binding protein [Mameliella alba]